MVSGETMSLFPLPTRIRLKRLKTFVLRVKENASRVLIAGNQFCCLN
jgi:hypothetical protein